MYSFDVSKLEKISNYLQKDGWVKFPRGYKHPIAEELSGKEFCKYHRSFSHSTNKCLVFWNYIQRSIERGLFKFDKEPKQSIKIEKNPFQHMADVNMINISNTVRGRAQIEYLVRSQLVVRCSEAQRCEICINRLNQIMQMTTNISDC